MIRVFDLSMESHILTDLINEPNVRIIRLNYFCSAETGYTTAHLRYQIVKESIARKRRRHVRRFLLFDGRSEYLDQIMDDPVTKIIKEKEFLTAQGVIIVLDYEVPRERLWEDELAEQRGIDQSTA